MRFTGSIEELEQLLASLLGDGSWECVNSNEYRFQHSNGAIIEWYTATGNIVVRFDSESILEHTIREALSRSGGSKSVQVNTAEPSLEKNGDRPERWQYLGHRYADSELVIGLVGAVGTDLGRITELLEQRFRAFNYTCETLRISKDIISDIFETNADNSDQYACYNELMDLGNNARRDSKDHSILSLAVAAHIYKNRVVDSDNGGTTPLKRHAIIVRSLKHPEEVKRLREIYSQGFFCIGVHEDFRRRRENLINEKRISPANADYLLKRDSDETEDFGQHTSDAFHQSDFFVHVTENEDNTKKSIWRLLDLIFGKPYVTPTFDEFAMFMAFSSALRSADLSRQVGAVVAKNEEILSLGANDTPRYGGGLYWPRYNQNTHDFQDENGGRDYTRGYDSNKQEKEKIIREILRDVPDSVMGQLNKALRNSQLNDISEYGRVVHAEMEALLSCARTGAITKGATLFSTTFPCHNCAKHIVAAGIERVVYVEPYPKSKAAEFHSDSINLGFDTALKLVSFEPFVGVGPRSFFNLFSVNLGAGYIVRRKEKDGKVVEWKPETSKLRMQLLPCSYLERETVAADILELYLEGMENDIRD